MDLRKEIERIKQEGYNEANAEAKLCQDIVLKAISESGMGRNCTIKGGVVMRSLSKNARRATQDLEDVVKRVERVFDNEKYAQMIEKSDKNWIELPIDAVLKEDIEFIKKI